MSLTSLFCGAKRQTNISWQAVLFWAKDGNSPNATSKGEPMPFFKSTAGTTDVLKHNQACIVLATASNCAKCVYIYMLILWSWA